MISEWITSTTRYWIYVTQFDPDETLEDRSSNFYRNARFGHVREVMNSAEFCEATRVKNTETEKKKKSNVRSHTHYSQCMFLDSHGIGEESLNIFGRTKFACPKRTNHKNRLSRTQTQQRPRSALERTGNKKTRHERQDV